ncbi:MAG: PEP-CTERM sorting domain-containing protein [Pirellulaceae bacterium]
MRNLIVFFGFVFGGFSCATSNADFVLKVSFQLTTVSGVDTLGLNNANVSFDARFFTGTVYTSVFGIPAAETTSHSLTITGASNAASNGTFSDPDGFLYAPSAGFEGLFIDNAANYLFYRTPTIASGLSFKFGLSLTSPPIAPIVGSYVNPTDFATTANPSPTSSLEAVTGDFVAPSAEYNIVGPITTSYIGSTNPVPEPGSILLVGTAFVVFGLRRRCRL